MKKYKGIFITFEGIDGSGKSTQAKMAERWLKKSGYNVKLIREPGGTTVSEKIRNILLNKNLDINPIGELMLYEAARAQLTTDLIIPELKKGTILISDRFYDSTVAYQGYGRGLDLKLIEKLNDAASFSIAPDLTFIIDVDYNTSLKRRKSQPDRLEKEKKAFFLKVRRGFKEISKKRRAVLIDGRDDIDTIFSKIQARILKKLK